MRIFRPALQLLVLFFLAACSGGANKDGPEAGLDTGVPDTAGLDTVAAADGGKDRLVVDTRAVDLVATDLAVDTQAADKKVPEAAVPDAALPDAAVPDTTVPDMAMADKAIPDAAAPDIPATPDSFVPVKGKWTKVGPPITGGYIVYSLVVDKTTVYASVTPGSGVSVRVLNGFSGTWAVVTGLMIPSKNSRVPMVLHGGAVILGMPYGISSSDKKIFHKASGATTFTARPVGFHQNLSGIAELISNGTGVYGMAYKGAYAESLISSTDGGLSYSISKINGHLPGNNSRGFASGARLFFYGDGQLRYSDNGGVSCTTVISGVVAGAGDGKHVVVQTGAGKNVVGYSADNGKTFLTVKPGMLGISPYAMAAADGCFYLSNKLHMLRSCDGGASWGAIDDGAPKSGYISNPPHAMAASAGYIYGFFGTQLYRYPTK